MTSIGAGAFYYCSGLTSVTIPNSVTTIGNQAFDHCFGLTSVNISDVAAWCNIKFECDPIYSCLSNPLSHAQHLYLNGEEIKDLVIPNSVTSIGEYVFYCFSGFTSVTIPNSVTRIGKYAFLGCSGLTAVHILDLEAWCKISFSSGSNPLSHAQHLYLNGEEIKNLVIPNRVTRIEDYAFYGCSGLTSVDVPNSVKSIGEYAFWGCSGLTSLTISNSVMSIGKSAFYDCSVLTSVTIGSGIKNIYSHAFASCLELTDVYCYAVKVPNTETDAL